MENLSEILRQEAVERNLCAKWTREWADNSNQQELIDKYKRGIDFILQQGEWPSNEFIRENFDRELLNANGVYVDQHIDLHDAPDGVYILNGLCDGVMRFSGFAAATIYLRHESNVTILATDSAKVFVRIYDDADAGVIELGDASVMTLYRR